MKKIVWFSHYHNGDLHLSRTIIHKIMEKVQSLHPGITFAYSHQNQSNLLSDIPNLSFDPESIHTLGHFDNEVRRDDTIYINTWYNQSHGRYMNKYGITFDCLYSALDDTCQSLWNFSLSDISSDIRDFFPSINYEKFEIDNVRSWIKEHPNKKILVENGEALSGQAVNFAMMPIIIQLTRKHPDIIFILSKKENVIAPNIVYTDDIIKKKQGSDLNEISYLSTFCDMLIGKASGIFTFALTQENLFKRKMKFIAFTNLPPGKNGKFWLNSRFQDQINYSASFNIQDIRDPRVSIRIIEEQL